LRQAESAKGSGALLGFGLSPVHVIPAQTGIQYFQIVKIGMDSRFRGNDNFLRGHQLFTLTY